MQIERFNNLFYILAKSKGRELDAGTCKVWYEDTKEFSDADIEKAFVLYRRDPEPFLVLGKFIAFMKPEITDAMIQDGWNTALSHYTGHGVSPEISEAVQQLGGWDVIGYTEYGIPQEMLKKRFCAAYEVILQRNRQNNIITGQIVNNQKVITDGK